MVQDRNPNEYTRRIAPLERFMAHSPYSVVTMVARVKGEITERMVRDAVAKVQRRHPHLRVRVVGDERGDLWFTSDGAEEIPVEVVPRESDDHWISLVQESCRIPFEFDVRPAIRFVLVRSPATSELIILCHHVIGDGLSLAYLARDLMVHLGDPAQQVEVLPDPVPIDRDHLPEGVSLNPIVRFFVNRINERWKRERVSFDQEDYENLARAYWATFRHEMLSIELDKAETGALIDRCRENGVTVNSALTAAFAGAQAVLQGAKAHHPSIGVAGSLRDHLPAPAGEVMGCYAGAVILKHRHDGGAGFWENARRLHTKIVPLFATRTLFKDPLVWCYLEPGLVESMNFKPIGGLVPPHASRHEKLSAFAGRDDVILSLLKRDRMETLDKVFMGTAVTNLGRMDFPRRYGALELDRLIMKPGGGFPLATVNLVVGAVTCAGKLSLVIEYVEENIDTGTMERIRDRALEFLRR
jgi:NRPS condensation-like uncharacterized protein